MATMVTMLQLLDCSIPIWPTQLGWYTEMAWSLSEVHGGWTKLVHPSGAIYNYNVGMKTFAKMNLRTCSEERLWRLESWVRVSRAKLNRKGYLLVVEPIVVQEKEVYPYYYVVPENYMITWVEPVNGYLLSRNLWHCTGIIKDSNWRLNFVRALRIQLNWYHIEALAIEQSTAASIFWTLDQMKEMTDELIITGMYLYLHHSIHINQIDD
ncbi:uncharacterized protein BJ212DRAFT_1299343 [Suillus subaureus]|uniref:Uncharacterized protein n=1 Tax=Suillus subaureus TaxID=48587 RepID=A0A9P7JE85_9AGAM|nr:uncharacterized protein BJ212DRAFT_1299343 [Suillus subaureus]KAG1817180.1 hypothetical protein BJ212DRAFT_1299343 [Suillus subaureus]